MKYNNFTYVHLTLRNLSGQALFQQSEVQVQVGQPTSRTHFRPQRIIWHCIFAEKRTLNGVKCQESQKIVFVTNKFRKVSLNTSSAPNFFLDQIFIIMLLSPELYVKVYSGVFSLYAAQMLFAPSKMVTDHFDVPATPSTNYWIRGSSTAFFCMVTLAMKLAEYDAVYAAKVCTGASLMSGLLFPWNSKFGILSKLPVKYPMHYVPEVLMLGLTVLGYLSITSAE